MKTLQPYTTFCTFLNSHVPREVRTKSTLHFIILLGLSGPVQQNNLSTNVVHHQKATTHLLAASTAEYFNNSITTSAKPVGYFSLSELTPTSSSGQKGQLSSNSIDSKINTAGVTPSINPPNYMSAGNTCVDIMPYLMI